MMQIKNSFTQVLRNLSKPVAGILLAASITGCVGILAGGAVIATMAATDRRSIGTQADDEAINVKGENQASNIVGQAGHVNVSVFNRKVLLTGEARDVRMKSRVYQAISRIEGVGQVVNELKIGPVSSISSRSSDTLITGKVKASFIDAKDVFANAFKVVTERGVVYLMGRVTAREGDRAAGIARGVNGVMKVVKVFDVITEDELKQLSSQPASNQPRARNNNNHNGRTR